jgi:hypothetical protein
MQNDNEQPIDPYLSEKLDLLRETPARDLQAAARGRERFLAELDSIPSLNPISTVPGIMGRFKRKKETKEDNPMSKRFVFSAVLAVVVIAVLLFGGAGATAFAAQGSLPGDVLFPVKTGLEQTQVRLAQDAYNQAQLHLRFAERRLDEIDELIKSGRYEDVKIASSEFEYYVQQALSTLQVVMTGDPARASQLTEQISAAMLAYVDALKGVWVNVPDNVRPAVLQAILTTQSDDLFEDDSQDELEFTGVVEAIGPDSWQVGGTVIGIGSATELKGDIQIGDQVKVHARIGADGSLVAREIERADDADADDANGNDDDDNGNDDDANGNDDDANGNDDDNGNDDANDNDDDGNDNDDDDNGNDDDDNGDDSNDNGDDSNDNGDDSNGNSDDSNDNGDDSNDNGDDSNDNGDDSNDNGDDSNDNGDDSNDNGDDSNDNGGDDDDDGGDD